MKMNANASAKVVDSRNGKSSSASVCSASSPSSSSSSSSCSVFCVFHFNGCACSHSQASRILSASFTTLPSWNAKGFHFFCSLLHLPHLSCFHRLLHHLLYHLLLPFHLLPKLRRNTPNMDNGRRPMTARIAQLAGASALTSPLNYDSRSSRAISLIV